jgi:hypothetical protein
METDNDLRWLSREVLSPPSSSESSEGVGLGISYRTWTPTISSGQRGRKGGSRRPPRDLQRLTPIHPRPRRPPSAGGIGNGRVFASGPLNPVTVRGGTSAEHLQALLEVARKRRAEPIDLDEREVLDITPFQSDAK